MRGLDFYQCSGNSGSVGRVYVFGLRWCRRGVDRGLDIWKGGVMSM